MNRIFSIALLSLCMACTEATTEHTTSGTEHLAANSKEKIAQESFDVGLLLRQKNADNYQLEVSLELKEDAYVISPYSNDDTYSGFLLSLEDSKLLQREGKLIEKPEAVEEYDEVLKEPVRFIRENTVFTQKLKLLSEEDFDASGQISFVLEPSCIPFDMDFTIQSRSGQVKLLSSEAKIAATYRGVSSNN